MITKKSIILFDADNTLYDFDATLDKSVEMTWKEYSIPLNNETKNCFLKYENQCWSQVEQGVLTVEDLKTLRFKLMFEELGLIDKIDPKEFGIKYLENVSKFGILYEESEEVLRTLKSWGYKIIIISNGISEIQKCRFKREINELNLYDQVYCGNAVGFNKPSKLFFEKVFEGLSLDLNNKNDREKAVVVGDSLNSDIQGGISAGIETIWYNRHSKNVNKTSFLPNIEICQLEELLRIFQQKI